MRPRSALTPRRTTGQSDGLGGNMADRAGRGGGGGQKGGGGAEGGGGGGGKGVGGGELFRKYTHRLSVEGRCVCTGV